MEAKKITASTIRKQMAEKQKNLFIKIIEGIENPIDTCFYSGGHLISAESWKENIGKVKLLPEVIEYVYEEKGIYITQNMHGMVSAELFPKDVNMLFKYPLEKVKEKRKTYFIQFFRNDGHNPELVGNPDFVSELIDAVGRKSVFEMQKKIVDDTAKFMDELGFVKVTSGNDENTICDFLPEVIKYATEELGFDVKTEENDGTFTITLMVPGIMLE